MNDRERTYLVDRARVLYPEAFERVLRTCRFVADDVDVELHVARIVLVAHGGLDRA